MQQEYPKVTQRNLSLWWPDIDILNYHFNHDKWAWANELDIPNAHREADDFDVFSSDAWTVTVNEGVSGACSVAAGDSLNGYVIAQTGSTLGDWIEAIWPNETWELLAGYPLIFEARVKVSDALYAGAWIGLVKKPGIYGTSSDYVVFGKAADDASILFNVCQNSVAVSVDTGINAEDLTWIRLGFHYDGAGKLFWYIRQDEDEPQTFLAVGFFIDGTDGDIPDDELLTKGFGVITGEADVNALYVDYMKVAQRRVIE